MSVRKKDLNKEKIVSDVRKQLQITDMRIQEIKNRNSPDRVRPEAVVLAEELINRL